MTTPTGIERAILRLRRCDTLAELKHRWGCFGIDYRENADVIAVKEQLKRDLE